MAILKFKFLYKKGLLKMLIKTTYLSLFITAFMCYFFNVETAYSFTLPFNPYMAPQSFGCKHLIIPGAEILPHDPVIDGNVLPGWKTIRMKKNKGDKTIESLIIKGSTIVALKDKNGKTSKDPMILIPAGGLVYDATPLMAHLPVGDTGVLFGKKATLLKKTLKEETCHNFSVLAGRSFLVGDSVITYIMPGPKKGPAALWRSLDGVSIRPHAFDEYPIGNVPQKTSTRIFGVYTHAGQIAEYSSFSAPMMVEELWRIDGKNKKIITNSEIIKHFRIVPISCPIGHHIGLMVYNDIPIILDTKNTMKLFNGKLKIKIIKIHKKSGKVLFSLNGKPYTGTNGIDSIIGKGRVVDGIKNTISILHRITSSNTQL